MFQQFQQTPHAIALEALNLSVVRQIIVDDHPGHNIIPIPAFGLHGTGGGAAEAL